MGRENSRGADLVRLRETMAIVVPTWQAWPSIQRPRLHAPFFHVGCEVW